MKAFLMLPLLLLLGVPEAHAQAPATIWRCEVNGRIVYQQAPCVGRQVGTRDRRTEAQKRAERDAAKREREREKEAAAAQAAEAASAAGATAAAGPAATAAAGALGAAPAASAASAPRRKP
jgi:hypothetical protein